MQFSSCILAVRGLPGCVLQALRRTTAAASLAIAISVPVLAQTTGPQEPANEAANGQEQASDVGEAAESAKPEGPKLPVPVGARRLSRDYDVWLDSQRGVVIVDGQISLREGMLEMFACTRNTKEHESVVSANTKAFLVHAALLRLGAEPGSPAKFVPEYQAPTGTEIEIYVEWQDEAGQKKSARAQDWVQNMTTKEAMSHPFVFAGSYFLTDPETGKQYYQAEGGDFICVSNFGTAMLDIPVPSSQTNDELMFQAFTERIPPLGAPVRLILKPQLKKNREESSAKRDPKAEGEVQKAE